MCEKFCFQQTVEKVKSTKMDRKRPDPRFGFIWGKYVLPERLCNERNISNIIQDSEWISAPIIISNDV